MAFSIKRLRTHASIALANALAIFITIYSGWNLTEATFAYLGEFVILALVVYARVFAAKQLSGGGAGWKLVGGKAIAIGITLPLSVAVVTYTLLLLFGNSGPRGEGFLATVRHGLDASEHAAWTVVVLGRLSRASCHRVRATHPRGRL